MGRRLINSFSKRKNLEFFEDDSGALDGRYITAWLINYVQTVETEVIGEETVDSGVTKEYKRDRKIMGVEQSLSLPIGMLNSDGYRGHIKKTLAVNNVYELLVVGDRLEILGRWYTVFSLDPFVRENFTIYYLEEISINETEVPS